MFHLIIPTLSLRWLGYINAALFPGINKYNFYLLLFENTLLLLFTALLSWQIIEKPFLNFKKYYNHARANVLPKDEKHLLSERV